MVKDEKLEASEKREHVGKQKILQVELQQIEDQGKAGVAVAQ